VRLQDFSNLDSTQESEILDEEKTILEHAQEPEHAPEFIPRVLDTWTFLDDQ